MRAGWMAAAVTAGAVAIGVATLHGSSAPRTLGPNPVVIELFTSQG